MFCRFDCGCVGAEVGGSYFVAKACADMADHIGDGLTLVQVDDDAFFCNRLSDCGSAPVAVETSLELIQELCGLVADGSKLRVLQGVMRALDKGVY